MILDFAKHIKERSECGANRRRLDAFIDTCRAQKGLQWVCGNGHVSILPILMILASLNIFAGDPVRSTSLPSGGTWEGIVGVSGGIPNRTSQAGSTLGTSSTAAQINSAIAAASSNQFVQLASGTFSSLGANDILVAKNGVTLRGATNANGLPDTTLVLATGRLLKVQNATWDYDSPGDFTTRTIASGHTRGSTTITTTAAPTGLTTGTLIFITCPRTAPTIDGNPSAYYANWFGSTDNHPYSAIHKVTGVSGSDISFSPPINADYISTNTCKVHYRSFANQIVLSGIENLVITNAAGAFDDDIVEMQGADQCWVLNCHLYGVGDDQNPSAGMLFRTSSRVEIRRNRVEKSTSFGSSEYGMVTFQCSGFLVENNVWYDLPNVWPAVATSGSVFAYNYCYWQHYGSAAFLSQLAFSHGAHNHYNLYEGNWIPTHYHDETADGNYTHSRNVVHFRERLRGWDEYGPKTDNLHAITLQNHHDQAVVAGCVMGTSGKQTDYFSNGTVGTPHAIFNIDTVSSNTLQRIANYNTLESGIHSGEALSGGDALVNSYLHSSKPEWFGDRPWPWVDPVTNSTSLASTTFTNLPAGYRFTFSADPPAEAGGGGSPAVSRANVLRIGTIRRP